VRTASGTSELSSENNNEGSDDCNSFHVCFSGFSFHFGCSSSASHADDMIALEHQTVAVFGTATSKRMKAISIVLLDSRLLFIIILRALFRSPEMPLTVGLF
jgi:hypothetical protein